jgi:hypothetical protein
LGAAAVTWGAWWWCIAEPEPRPVLLVSLWLATLLLCGLALYSRLRVRNPGQAGAAALAIIALGLIPRLWNLADAPYSIASDEAVHPLLGMRILNGDLWSLIAGVSSPFYIVGSAYPTQLLQAWPILFSEPLFGARLASVTMSVVSLSGTYALARRLFGSGAALITLVLLVSSHWHIVFARTAHPYAQPIALLPWALYALLVGVEERNRLVQFVAGVLLALSLLVYTPARIAFPIVALWVVHRMVSRTLVVREAITMTLAVALGAAVFLSPYLHRAGVRSVFMHYQDAATGEDSPLTKIRAQGWGMAPGILWTQLRTSTSIYYVPEVFADFAPHDHSPAPLLDPVFLVLGVAGLCGAMWNVRDHRCFLLLAWIGLTLVLGQMLTDFGPRAAYRASPILPALAICGGWAAASAWSRARRRFGGTRSWPDVAALVVLAAMVLPPNLYALQIYMMRREQDEIGAMARTIGRGAVDAVYHIVDGEPRAGHFAVELLAGKRELHDVTSLMDTLGRGIDESRPAVFVLSSEMAAALEAIRRCYPSAALNALAGGPEPPVVTLSVSSAGVQSGRDCAVAEDGSGLLARYSGGRAAERLEDWPVRFWRTQEPFSSVEWTGSLLIPVAGTYGFQLLTGDGTGSAAIGSKIRLNGNQSGEESFSAGMHDLRIGCEPGATQVGYCYLRWRPPGTGDYETIAPQFFLPPRRSR